jgi:hypothetical protein
MLAAPPGRTRLRRAWSKNNPGGTFVVQLSGIAPTVSSNWSVIDRIGLTMATRFFTSTAILLLSAAQACHAVTPGVVSLNVGRDDNFYFTQRLLPSDFVAFQYPGRKGRLRCCLEVRGKSLQSKDSDEKVEDALHGEAVFAYTLRKRPPAIAKMKIPFLAIAAGGQSMKARGSAGESIQVRAPGLAWVIRACTSQEGFHVLASSGRALVADLYYALDYSIEQPTCTQGPTR